ncbi:hypothetical protein MC885_003344 [Smutsia gigantea]|nr:hypothetical protein MC885_003344 [Smutsia gigantea]
MDGSPCCGAPAGAGSGGRPAALREDSVEAAVGEPGTWVVDVLCGLQKAARWEAPEPAPFRETLRREARHCAARRRRLPNLRFSTEDPVVKGFLAWDKNLRCLKSYLASDLEEDNQGPKQAIFSILYGKNHFQRPLFHKL